MEDVKKTAVEKNKLTARDLITVGIITVLYFAAFFISGMLGYIPILVVFLPFILGVLGALPFLVLLTKVPKFGAITILGTLVSLLCYLMGQSWISIPFGVVFGLAGDLIIRRGAPAGWRRIVLGYAVFTEWVIGSMLPMWIMRDAFFKKYESVGPEYMEAVKKLTTTLMLPVIVVLGLVGAVAGIYVARILLKKHVKRAGIL